MDKIQSLTPRFIEFIRGLGYKGEIRSHDDRDGLVVSTFTSKVTKVSDFEKNQEATAKLYQKLGIQGDDFGTFLDMNMTVSDILVPVVKLARERVLVFVGIEEYYFPKLAQIVADRLREKYGDMFVPEGTKISAIFGRLINGLNGYPKMSKSIPDSSVNLDDTEETIRSKMLECDERDEQVMLQMIQLVSDWDLGRLAQAKKAYEEKSTDWRKIKSEYVDYFLGIKRQWEKTKPRYQATFDLRKSFFGGEEAA